TLLGTLAADSLQEVERPAYVERILAYMRKAARESKVHTRWTHPDPDYEDALEKFVRVVLTPGPHNLFLDDLQALADTLAWFGAFNSLATVLLKFSCPGVPDLYQGQERIHLTLVDPDNRAPVDYDRLGLMLTTLQSLDPSGAIDLLADAQDGRAKMWITWRMLSLRRDRELLFRDGDYTALATSGSATAHIVAFKRQHRNDVLIVLVPRLLATLMEQKRELPLGPEVWGDTRVAVELPDGTRLTDVLTGAELPVRDGQIRVSAAFATLPLAALIFTS
ncbi:MAG: malto-oligosyltrehalose synthase, partial [Betaproteobacteria bacterium]